MPVLFGKVKKRKPIRLKFLVFIILALISLAQLGPFTARGVSVSAEIEIDATGSVSSTSANVRTGAGTTFSLVCSISKGYPFAVLSQVTGEYVSTYGTDQWYRIKFMNNGVEKTGFVLTSLVALDPAVQPDAEFELYLDSQGFPESYRVGLRRLHAKYPSWVFKSVQTGLNFNDAVDIMYSPGYSLIINSYNDAWKSLDQNAYDWYTNTWKAYDGSTWVMCSRDLVAFYMDPRNMMLENSIFQFEMLNYQPAVHHATGVEVILRNSFMSNSSFEYFDQDTQSQQSTTYADAFMKAAELNNISPYHLAARSLIEVGSNGSPSVTGLFSQALLDAGLPLTYDYDGYYNFYNIGASASTVPLGNIRNGLEYAKLGSDRKIEQTSFDDACLIPWNDRRRAIVGGSYIIGSRYINASILNNNYADQNTLYLQKFNVALAPVRRYWHLYMGSIIAPVAEGAKLHRAYYEMGDLQKPITFLIPLFDNMPEKCILPAASGNPNNWLSTLSVDGYSITPTFDASVSDNYSLIVDYSVSSINVSATPVSAKSSINGTGFYNLNEGANVVTVTVTAENGSVKIYTITVYRGDASTAPTPVPTLTPETTPVPTLTPEPTLTPTAAPTATPTLTIAPTAAPTPIPTETPIQNTNLLSRGTLMIKDDFITGLDPINEVNTVDRILSDLIVPDGCTSRIVRQDGQPVTGQVGTGSIVQVFTGDILVKPYIVILYGDSNGDGRITSSDLNAIFQHILGKNQLTGVWLMASNADKNDKVSSYDLNLIFKHVLRQQLLIQ